jgi:hypothetical protein
LWAGRPRWRSTRGLLNRAWRVSPV